MTYFAEPRSVGWTIVDGAGKRVVSRFRIYRNKRSAVRAIRAMAVAALLLSGGCTYYKSYGSGGGYSHGSGGYSHGSGLGHGGGGYGFNGGGRR